MGIYIKHRTGSLLLCITLLAFTQCRNSGDKIPDVSGIQISLHTSRFDEDLYALDTKNITQGLRKLHDKYPDFLDYYLDTIMAYNIYGNYSDTAKGVREGLLADLTEKGHIGLEDTIMKYYPNNKDVDEALTAGFKLMKYYFPDYTVPKIIYLDMGLSNWPAFPLDKSTFCIGLDMFLGGQYPYYRSIGVPDYMKSHLNRSYIPVSVFSAVYKSIDPFHTENRTLLDMMIQRGKEQYFLHRVLPRTPDSVLFGFTQVQVNWCNSNEALTYNFFIHQNLLYSKELQSTQAYIYDGPFAKGLEPVTNPVKSTPGNIGTWLGYKIVCSYMAQHPGMTLKQLWELKEDPAAFIEGARYRPK